MWNRVETDITGSPVGTTTHNQGQLQTPLSRKQATYLQSRRENAETAIGGADMGHSNKGKEAGPTKELCQHDDDTLTSSPTRHEVDAHNTNELLFTTAEEKKLPLLWEEQTEDAYARWRRLIQLLELLPRNTTEQLRPMPLKVATQVVQSYNPTP